jgi:hypothetical protein
MMTGANGSGEQKDEAVVTVAFREPGEHKKKEWSVKGERGLRGEMGESVGGRLREVEGA